MANLFTRIRHVTDFDFTDDLTKFKLSSEYSDSKKLKLLKKYTIINPSKKTTCVTFNVEKNDLFLGFEYDFFYNVKMQFIPANEISKLIINEIKIDKFLFSVGEEENDDEDDNLTIFFDSMERRINAKEMIAKQKNAKVNFVTPKGNLLTFSGTSSRIFFNQIFNDIF